MQTIVTLTMNPTIDSNASVAHVVNNKKLRCSKPSFEPGGGGINVARAIHRLEGESTALYTCGGADGELLKHLLSKEKVQHHPIPIHEMTRRNFIITETSTSNQYRFGVPGPQLKSEEWQRCLTELKSMTPPSAYIVASGSLPRGVPDDFYKSVAEIAADRDARLILDTSSKALKLALHTGIFLLKPSIRELQELVEREIKTEEQQEEFARELIEQGYSKYVVLSLGNAGALLVSETSAERVRSPSVPIKSRIGAGDSMVAGIVLKLAQGKAFAEAGRFGIAAGAAAVMTPGTELCRKEDTERLYERIAQERSS